MDDGGDGKGIGRPFHDLLSVYLSECQPGSRWTMPYCMEQKKLHRRMNMNGGRIWETGGGYRCVSIEVVCPVPFFSSFFLYKPGWKPLFYPVLCHAMYALPM